MTPMQRTLQEERIDETAAESFPASDAPNWSALHAGGPLPQPWALEHSAELRAALRADIERLSGAGGYGDERESAGELDQERPSPEEIVAHSMLEAGRSVLREPVDPGQKSFNVEAEQQGALGDAPCVVLGARYGCDDVSGAAMFLALGRILTTIRTQRTLRLVAFSVAGGSARYVKQLRDEGARIHAMVSLARLDLAREGNAILFVGNLRSLYVARAARDVFRRSSRVPARVLPFPSWVSRFAGVASSDAAAFWHEEWPAVTIADAPSLLASRRSVLAPDVDRMAAALPGLVAVAVHLAGGRA
jgi:hypothetical protein